MDNSIREHTCLQSPLINSCMNTGFSFLFPIYFLHINRINLINHQSPTFSFNSRKQRIAKYSRLLNKFGLGEFVMKIFILFFHLLKSKCHTKSGLGILLVEANIQWFAYCVLAFTSMPSHCVSFPRIVLKPIWMSQWHLNWIDSYKRNSNYPSSFFILIPPSDEFVGMFVHLIQYIQIPSSQIGSCTSHLQKIKQFGEWNFTMHYAL